jgi:iron complex outermembrane receptor protein
MGDESYQKPTLPGYVVIILHTSFAIADLIQLFANVQNLLNANYATFAQYGDPTGVGAPGVPTNGVGVDNRFLAPGAPIAVYGGVKVKF